jgi:hypothetical protein
MRHFKQLAGILALATAGVSCGDVVREGKSPVFVVIDSLQGIRGAATLGQPSGTLTSDVVTLVTSPAPCSTTAPCPTVFNDQGRVQLRLVPKDIGTPANPTTPSLNNEVTVYRYRVRYIRADGRNTQGVDVPYGFDGAVTATVPSTGTVQVGFELVRHIAKEEAPLVQLATSSTIISTIAEITFYGRDRVGNEVSVTGSITVDFGNFGDF